MVTLPRLFDENLYYHIYNCGVEKRTVFTEEYDYFRFAKTAAYYLHDQKISYIQFQELTKEVKEMYEKLNPKGLETQRVKILSFCFMPNHFHFVIKLAKQGGITQFISEITNSYTRYFNIKNHRLGSLFQGTFKAKEIDTDESLLQVIRYIHLNSVVSSKTNPYNVLKPEDYPFSSYKAWIGLELNPKGLIDILDQEEIKRWVEFSGGFIKYKEFVDSKIGKNPMIGIEDLILEDELNP